MVHNGRRSLALIRQHLAVRSDRELSTSRRRRGQPPGACRVFFTKPLFIAAADENTRIRRWRSAIIMTFCAAAKAAQKIQKNSKKVTITLSCFQRCV